MPFVITIIRSDIYKDKVKITSPGGLYKTCLDDMLKGVQTYRNTRLVHLLDKLGFIENFGTGIPKTLDAYSKFNKKPEFFDSENFFMVYLPNLNYSDQINDQINDAISDLGLPILRFIKENPGTKVPNIYKELSHSFDNLSIDKIRNIIKREIRDYVELKGSRKKADII